ncbi:MAG: DUF1801 domain-containing protein [Ferruginibacter sp.]
MKTVQQGTIDEYIAGYPKDVQKILQDLRLTIRKAAPDAAESINYGIPTFTLKGNLVHFGAHKNHIGFYPAPSGIIAFQKELSVYEGAKGSIKFPIEKPLPLALISKIVKFRVKENLEKAAAKTKPTESFLSSLSVPARRALENKGITSLKQLAKFSEEEILALHGMGQGSIPKLASALKAAGLSFKK